MLSPGDINTKKFDKSAFGYKVDEVDTYLTTVAEEYAKILHDNNELENKMVVLAERLEEYRNEEKSLGAALLGAQKMSDSLLREAKEKAEQIINEANGKAQKLIESAHNQVLIERNELARVQREIGSFKNSLLGMYKAQMDLIRALPDANRPRSEQEVPAPKEEKPTRFVYDDVQEVEEVNPVEQPKAPTFSFSAPAAPAAPAAPVKEEPKLSAPEVKKPEVPAVAPVQAAPTKQPLTPAKGFVPNLADDDIGSDAYQGAYPPFPQKAAKPSTAAPSIRFEKEETDDVPLASDPSTSKFGELKFGAAYDLKRDGNFGGGKNYRKKR